MSSGMLLQYNTSEIYTLGSTNNFQQPVNMDGLFVSPAGRELMKQKSQYHQTKSKLKHSYVQKTLPTVSSLINDETDNIPHLASSHHYSNGINTNGNNKLEELIIVPNSNHFNSDEYNFNFNFYKTSSNCCTSSSSNSTATLESSSCMVNETSTSTSSCPTVVSPDESSNEKLTNSEISQSANTCDNFYDDEIELLLGINCVLEDDCRCLECQSSYFDYTEDDDLDNNFELRTKLDPCHLYSNSRRHHLNHTNMYCCIQ